MLRRFRLVIIVLIPLLLITSLFYSSAKAVLVDVQSLNPSGAAYEIHADVQGYLWVSDYSVGEIWKVDPAGGSPLIYDVGGYPGDAQPDNQGGVWWVDTPDSSTPTINKLDDVSGDSLSWDLDGSFIPYGLAIDSLSRVWVTDTDYSYPYIYRFNPTNRELCTYPLPDGGYGYYPAALGNYVWLGDSVNGRILRINIETNRIDWWQLPYGSNPYGLKVEAVDRIWITDSGTAGIGLLVPSTGVYTFYALPIGTQINLLGLGGGKVWYTEQYQPSFGVLDPALAEGIESRPFTGWADIDPTPCATVGRPRSGSASPTLGPSDAAVGSADIIHNAGGWTVMQLPDGAIPWGIAYVDGKVSVVDNGRQKLVQLTESALQNPGLTLVKSAVPLTYDNPGDVISYSYKLTNGGNVTLSGPFTVTDDKTADEACPAIASLAPGAFITCSASYTVTQADLDAGSVTNIAAGHAMFGITQVNSNSDTETVTAVQSPALSLTKVATPETYDSVGDVINYSYLVKNTGNVTLAGPVTVTDDKTVVTCPAGGLAPAAEKTCTASYTITQADLETGTVTNTAQAHANGIHSNVAEEMVTANVQPPSYQVFLPLVQR